MFEVFDRVVGVGVDDSFRYQVNFKGGRLIPAVWVVLPRINDRPDASRKPYAVGHLVRQANNAPCVYVIVDRPSITSVRDPYHFPTNG